MAEVAELRLEEEGAGFPLTEELILEVAPSFRRVEPAPESAYHSEVAFGGLSVMVLKECARAS